MDSDLTGTVTDFRRVFELVTAHPRYLANLNWGEARPGHPEGTVRAHIAELEGNLDRLRARVTEEEYWKLRVLVHVHDSFKADAKRGVAITDARSHASLAREFLAGFCADAGLLAMVQFHDEPYALYGQFERAGTYNAERFERLLGAIGDWDVFLAFNIIDGCTAGKLPEPLRWWLRGVSGRVGSRFSEEDVMQSC
jgi:hypothetical protein